MKTVKEHNAQMMKKYEKSTELVMTGVECSMCGAELIYTNPEITLTSNPPQKDVHCSLCCYTGYLVV